MVIFAFATHILSILSMKLCCQCCTSLLCFPLVYKHLNSHQQKNGAEKTQHTHLQRTDSALERSQPCSTQQQGWPLRTFCKGNRAIQRINTVQLYLYEVCAQLKHRLERAEWRLSGTKGTGKWELPIKGYKASVNSMNHLYMSTVQQRTCSPTVTHKKNCT